MNGSRYEAIKLSSDFQGFKIIHLVYSRGESKGDKNLHKILSTFWTLVKGRESWVIFWSPHEYLFCAIG